MFPKTSPGGFHVALFSKFTASYRYSKLAPPNIETNQTQQEKQLVSKYVHSVRFETISPRSHKLHAKDPPKQGPRSGFQVGGA